MVLYQPQVVVCSAVSTSLVARAALVGKVLPQGFKYLVSRPSLRPIPEALHFLRKSCVGRVGAPRLKVATNTATARAEDLCNFYKFLDAEQLPLEEFALDDLFDYVNSMYGMVSPTTNNVYAKETIARRLSSVRPFLIFCQKQGWLKNRFEVTSKVVRGRVIETIEPGILHELVEAIDARVKHIPQADLQDLMNALGPWDKTEDQAPVSGPRDRLIGECALQAGLRRSEVTWLKEAAFRELRTSDRGLFSTVPISVLGKGNKWREVPFPVWLIRVIQVYIETDRAAAVSRRLAADPEFVDRGQLFVHGEDARGSCGDALQPKQMNRIFGAARGAVVALEPAGNNRAARFKTYTFHGLRHTYALVTYAGRRLAGDPSPGRFVQAVLGHARLETTNALYLKASQIHEAELSDFAQRHLFALLEAT